MFETTNIEQIKHHVKPRRNNLSTDKIKSIIVEHNFLTINHIKVSHIVKKINVMEPRYYLMLNASYLSVCEIDNYEVMVAQKNKMIKIDYENKQYSFFFEFCENIKSSKQALLILMESYKFLLKSIQLLNLSKICHTNISRLSIHLDGNCNFHPVIGEFQTSLLIDKITKADTIFKANQYLNQLLIEINILFTSKQKYNNYPLDVYILVYIYQNSVSSFTREIVNYLHTEYLKNLEYSGIQFYSEQQRDDFYNEAYYFLMRYIDQPAIYIVRELVQNITTWDNYSLGFEYILLLQHISTKFQLKLSFMDGFFAVLIQTIAPNPHERGSINNTIERYNRLFNENVVWNIN